MHEKSGWGTIGSVLVAVLVAIVPLAWRAQQQSEALKPIQNDQPELRKWREQQWRERQQPGIRHEKEIQYPRQQRDPRLVPVHEDIARQQLPGAIGNDPTMPHGSNRGR